MTAPRGRRAPRAPDGATDGATGGDLGRRSRQDAPGATEGSLRCSVIVPTLDEADGIVPCLRAARRALGPGAELLVVDGGSRDGTRERARRHASVIRAPRGRGAQQNAGARAARHRVLLFLHADTVLEESVGDAIRRCLADPAAVGGCCRFGVLPAPGGDVRYRLLEAAVNLRTRLFHTATGDQAIFVRADAFRRAGGFPDQPLFEDVALVRALRRLGAFRPVRAVARTSRRRWERSGFWRTVVLHWLLRTGWAAGIPPAHLARWYGAPGAAEEDGSRREEDGRPTAVGRGGAPA